MNMTKLTKKRLPDIYKVSDCIYNIPLFGETVLNIDFRNEEIWVQLEDENRYVELSKDFTEERLSKIYAALTDKDLYFV